MRVITFQVWLSCLKWCYFGRTRMMYEKTNHNCVEKAGTWQNTLLLTGRCDNFSAGRNGIWIDKLSGEVLHPTTIFFEYIRSSCFLVQSKWLSINSWDTFSILSTSEVLVRKQNRRTINTNNWLYVIAGLGLKQKHQMLCLRWWNHKNYKCLEQHRVWLE